MKLQQRINTVLARSGKTKDDLARELGVSRQLLDLMVRRPAPKGKKK